MKIQNDAWRAETATRLSTSLLYSRLKESSQSEPMGSRTVALVDDIVYYSYQRTKTIVRHMGEFTLHDGDHLFKVLALMEKILGPELIERLTAPEMLLLIGTAFFHDIGMAPEEADVLSWKKVWDKAPEITSERDQKEYDSFQRYCRARPEQGSELEALNSAGKNSQAELLKGYLISDYIRQTHATRARDIVEEDWRGKIKYRDTDLTIDFADLCFSHNEDAIKLLALDKAALCAEGVTACMPLIGTILRLADILDFDAKRTPQILFSHLWVRHPISLKEWNKHRSIQAWHIEPNLIQFHAKCSHPAIEASIHDFCDLIDKELSTCTNILNQVSKDVSPRLSGASKLLPLRIDRSRIETQKDLSRNPIYTYRKTQFSLSKSQVIDLLMGTKLYGSPDVAARELLQNSIDACLMRKAMEESWSNLYKPEIKVSYFTKDDQDILEVEDNGIGMDQDIIDNYYSKVGVSFYKSSEFYDLRAQTNAQFTPTSRFGIGILSCFMVADTIEVETRKVYGPHSSSAPLHVLVEGQESIFYIKPGLRKTPGTTTRLHLRRKSNPWERMSEEQFIKSIESTIPNPPFKIIIRTLSHESIRDEMSFDRANTDALGNDTWESHPNIRIINIKLKNDKEGVTGSVKVGLLEEHKAPVREISSQGKTIFIDEKPYDLDKKMKMGGNEIEQFGTSLSVDDDGEVETSTSYSSLVESSGSLSLHGIQIPVDLFPEPWKRQKNQAYLDWPFPMLILVDVNRHLDLDLNSARTQILPGVKWDRFEQHLAYLICSELFKQVSPSYLVKLLDVITRANNDNFAQGLDKASLEFGLPKVPIRRRKPAGKRVRREF